MLTVKQYMPSNICILLFKRECWDLSFFNN